jgi:uncharacterized protein YfkK (UPF0435 family)/uncharacterized protein YdcH (DUF465 family)
MARTVTLSSIRTQVRQRADMVNSTFVDNDEINQFINNSITELYDLLVQKFGNEYFLNTYSFSTVAGTDSYALPTDFYKLTGVDILVNGTDYLTLRPFMFSERNRFNGSVSRNILGVSDLRYRLLGSNIKFVPIPDSLQTIRLWYIPYVAELVSDSDTLNGVNGYEEYVIVDAAMKCLQKEESDVSVLFAQKQSLIKRIEEAAENRDVGYGERVSDVRRNDVGQDSWYV